MEDQIRQLLLDELHERMQRSRQRGPLAWLWPRRPPWPEAIYAFEYRACDAERTHCTGAVARAWLIDPKGPKETDVSPAAAPTHRCGLWSMWYCCPRFSFHIDPAGQWVVLASMNGPRAGHGGRYNVVQTGGRMTLVADGDGWKA